MNNKHGFQVAAAVLIGAWLAGTVTARAQWVTVGDLQTSIRPQEIAVSLPASICRIHALQGSVVIHTLVVREGPRHMTFTVGRRLRAGQYIDVDLGGARNITGLRIIDSSHGRYQVQLNTAPPPQAVPPRRRPRHWDRHHNDGYPEPTGRRPRHWGQHHNDGYPDHTRSILRDRSHGPAHVRRHIVPAPPPPPPPTPYRQPSRNWTRVAVLQTGPEAKEVGVNRNVSSLRIRVLEGTVVINTVVAREGAQRTAFTVGRRLQTGQTVDIDLGGHRNVTGLRISDDARGRYEIQAR